MKLATKLATNSKIRQRTSKTARYKIVDNGGLENISWKLEDTSRRIRRQLLYPLELQGRIAYDIIVGEFLSIPVSISKPAAEQEIRFLYPEDEATMVNSCLGFTVSIAVLIKGGYNMRWLSLLYIKGGVR